jgi:hypothetical protein
MSLKRPRGHRGCFGKSSGGYGSIIHGMKYAKYRANLKSLRGIYVDYRTDVSLAFLVRGLTR